jgi:CRISPR-associated protein Cas1
VKKLLNTLFVTTQGAYLSKEGETVVISVDNKKLNHFPLHTLSGIVCLGRVMCSPYLMASCGEKNVHISFFSENGRFQARVQGPVSGNVLLRREQYRRADSMAASVALTRSFLIGKISNSRTVLKRTLRDHGDKIPAAAQIQHTIDLMSGGLNRTMEVKDGKEKKDLDETRGIEGEMGGCYFDVFDHLILKRKTDFKFNGRTRRPPLDNVNSMLSFLYTVLCHDVCSALEGVGIDPQVGFLHRDRPGRPSLALDMMEEFRPYIVDRLVLSLINRGQVKPGGFQKLATGAILMDDDTRRQVITAYQKRKQDEILHPFINEKVVIGILFHVQALLLARHLRGDLDGYPPFIWR